MISTTEQLAIDTEALARSFGETKAVAGLDLCVRRGEMYGLVGPDGAGKSTAIRLLCGILRPSGGRARVLGYDLGDQTAEIKARIGYLSQSFTLYGDLTIDENLEFFADLHGVRGFAQRRNELLEFTRLTPFRGRLAQALSGGMKKKLALACTLIHTPELILLDEPSTGVDPVSRGEFWNILSGILEQGGDDPHDHALPGRSRTVSSDQPDAPRAGDHGGNPGRSQRADAGTGPRRELPRSPSRLPSAAVALEFDPTAALRRPASLLVAAARTRSALADRGAGTSGPRPRQRCSHGAVARGRVRRSTRRQLRTPSEKPMTPPFFHWSTGKRKLRFAWSVACGVLTTAVAGPAARITVEPSQVVSNALAYSRQVKSAELEVQAAGALERQARAQGLPKLSVDGRATTYTGLKDSSFGPLFTIPAIENRYGAGVSLNQPAFTGGRIASQKQGASWRQQAAIQNRQTAEADLEYRALSAYWGWSKAYYGLEAWRAAVQRTEALARETRDRLAAGLATESDALSTEVQLEQTRLRLSEGQRAVQLALATLRMLTGQEIPTNGEPKQADAPSAAPIPDETALIGAAWQHRPELEGSRLEAKAAESGVRGARSEYFPQVSLTARYETARPNLLNIPPQDRWEEDGFAGVTANWTVFDWGMTRAKVKEASLRAEQAKLRQEQWLDQIALEVRQARISLVDAAERAKVSERAEASARKNLESATSLWENGMYRYSELLEANARLTAAENEAAATRADWLLAEAALNRALGASGTARQP